MFLTRTLLDLKKNQISHGSPTAFETFAKDVIEIQRRQLELINHERAKKGNKKENTLNEIQRHTEQIRFLVIT